MTYIEHYNHQLSYSNYRINLVNRLKNGHLKPVLALSNYPNANIPTSSGFLNAIIGDDTIVLGDNNHTKELKILDPEDQRILIGYDEIDEYLEQSIEDFEQNNNITAGVSALNVIHRFNAHFEPINDALAIGILKKITTSGDVTDYLIASESGDRINQILLEIMLDYAMNLGNLITINDRAVDNYAQSISNTLYYGNENLNLGHIVGLNSFVAQLQAKRNQNLQK